MGRCIVKLDNDKFIEWSSVVDAPVSAWLPRSTAEATWGEDRVARADRNGHSALDLPPEPASRWVGLNRAGPNEECLTLDAIIRRYAPDADDSAPVTPGEILPGWSNDWNDAGEAEDEHGPVYTWRPWRPGEAPDVMPPRDEYRRMSTRIPPGELERLTAEGEQRG